MTHFRSLGQKSKNKIVWFLGQMRARKFASKIYWPLHDSTTLLSKNNLSILFGKMLNKRTFLILLTCNLGLIVKLPAVGFIQATYWQLWMSLGANLFRSYLNWESLVYHVCIKTYDENWVIEFKIFLASIIKGYVHYGPSMLLPLF